MATLTKTQLIDQIAALRHNAELNETALASLRNECAVLRQQLAARPAAAPSARPAYTPRPLTFDQLARRERMAAAKAEAMSTGRTVLV